MNNLTPEQEERIKKNKKNLKTFGIIFVLFLFLFPFGLFNKDKQSETPKTKTQPVQTAKQEEVIKEIFNKNAFLGKISKIEKVKDLIYTVTTVENKNQFNVLFDEAGNFKEFRVYIPDVVDFPLNISENKIIDESYFTNAINVEIPKIIEASKPREQGTVSQENALNSAINYLQTMAFSPTSLAKQLMYEGYSKEDAEFAVQNCGADWTEQTAKSASNYLQTMPFSKTGLIKQLSHEGFDKNVAKQLLDAADIDWNNQAALSANSYLETMSFSKKGLIQQLMHDGYTKEEATFGANQTGL